ncbi:MAG: phytoene/squalene synthase family protein [Rhodobacter sp.]|nr:phytoene/squalene synthase family protein [Rhodobacter sp.]
MIDPRDMDHCRQAIKVGSLSFHTASKLLPARVRDPALALYAFCRLADDSVDEHQEKADAVLSLRDRLDLVYAGRPRNAPADRAFAAIVEGFDMPRTLPEALLEGLAWDAVGRQYQTLSELLDYSARVASAVGAMMAVLMRVRDADALARACDLGLAMQLTNIARDVGEDARARRLYLPLDWMAEAEIDPDAFFADPLPSESVRAMVRQLLHVADRFYARSEPGIGALPLDCRPGIFAARHIYAGIGGAIRRNGYDTISWRGRTTKGQKLGWLGLSMLRSGVTSVMPRSAVLHAAPAPEVAFLVDAAARARVRPRSDWGDGRSGALLSIFAQLEAQDRAQRGV